MPGAASWDNGRIDVFAVASDSTVRHAFSNNTGNSFTWDNWGNPGVPIYNTATAVSWGPSRVDVFVLGLSNGVNTVYHKGWDHGSWSCPSCPGNWNSWGFPASGTLGAPGATATGTDAQPFWPRSIRIFVLGSDGKMWHGISSNGDTLDWPGWRDATSPPAGVTLVGDVDAASWADDNWSAFVHDSTGGIQWLQWETNPAFAFVWRAGIGKPNAPASASPGAVGMGDDQFIITNRFGNEAWYDYRYLGTWTGWTSFGGAPTVGIDSSSW
jgi:hypothetical protein